jgi:hypothetical protein
MAASVRLWVLLSVYGLLTLLPTATGHATTAATAAAFADRKQLALDGSDDAAADDFEFDLDISSKKKLKRLHQRLHEEGNDPVEVVTSADGGMHKWSEPLDISSVREEGVARA